MCLFPDEFTGRRSVSPCVISVLSALPFLQLAFTDDDVDGEPGRRRATAEEADDERDALHPPPPQQPMPTVTISEIQVKAVRKRCVLRLDLKDVRDGDNRICIGTEFHTQGA